MIFTSKPHYAVSLSRLVRFNHVGEFHTEDETLIEELKQLPHVTCGEVKQEKEETKTEPTIKELRAEYKKKFGKNPFGAWTEEEIKAKLAE